MLEARAPWEQLDGETAPAYAAFRAYRDAGPTRTADTAPAKRWRSRHRWTERARAWDDELHRLEDAHRLDAARRRLDEIGMMDEEHKKAGQALIQRALDALAEVDELSPPQIARFLQVGTQIERETLLGDHLAPVLVAVPELEEMSPLERIARDLADTA